MYSEERARKNFIDGLSVISKRLNFKTEKELKEYLHEPLLKRCEEIGEPDLLDRIADDDVGFSAEDRAENIRRVGEVELLHCAGNSVRRRTRFDPLRQQLRRCHLPVRERNLLSCLVSRVFTSSPLV